MIDRDFDESTFLEWLRREVVLPPDTSVGIGDDAAVVSVEGALLLLCTDSVREGVHAAVGRLTDLATKVVRCNVSDLAAMGGRPRHGLLSFGFGEGVGDATAKDVLRVVLAECRRWDLALVGGDTIFGGTDTVMTMSVTGTPFRDPVLRSGARPGDVIFSTGAFGGSILGRHASFVPRVEEARQLVEWGPPTAMIDVSDGLARDLWRLAEASGCGLIIESDSVPIHEDAVTLAQGTGRSPLDHALGDGEDFELVGTIAPRHLENLTARWNCAATLSVLGEACERRGVWLRRGDDLEPLPPYGYCHGKRPEGPR